MATRKVSTPGATETENTTGTASEPVAADATTSDAATDPTVQPEIEKAFPDDYEEYLAWKNSRGMQAEEPVIAVTAQASTQQANGVKRKRPVLTDKGWTQEEY